jgi:hypothetical protein
VRLIIKGLQQPLEGSSLTLQGMEQTHQGLSLIIYG